MPSNTNSIGKAESDVGPIHHNKGVKAIGQEKGEVVIHGGEQVKHNGEGCKRVGGETESEDEGDEVCTILLPLRATTSSFH
jgi:hypothetical protein